MGREEKEAGTASAKAELSLGKGAWKVQGGCRAERRGGTVGDDMRGIVGDQVLKNLDGQMRFELYLKDVEFKQIWGCLFWQVGDGVGGLECPQPSTLSQRLW